MKNAKLLIFTLLTATAISIHAQAPAKSPGLHEYKPTRIQWLTLVANAELRESFHGGSDINLGVVYIKTQPDTVLIVVSHDAKADPEAVKIKVATARRTVQAIADQYGWKSWVKIKERVDVNPIK